MPYRNNSDKAEDNRSSAWVLLIFGILGIIAVILGIAGVIPLKLGNPYMFYGIMGAVFVLFIVMGIVSMKNAIFFAGKAASDNTLQETMIKWCIENLNASDIDKAIEEDKNINADQDTEADKNEEAVISADSYTDEELYFKRYECIKSRLKEQFMNLDEGFLDNFIDEKVFDLVFGK